MYIDKYDLTVRFEPNSVHIVDSYKVTPYLCIADAIRIIREKPQADRYTRSAKSWYYEWVAHNWLYYHNIATDRTASVDLNNDEPLWRRLGYFIITLISYL